MDCYKLTIKESKYAVMGSQSMLSEIMIELFAGNDNAKNHIEFMFLETNTFPKLYYFQTDKDYILEKISSLCHVEESELPKDYILGNASYQGFGNGRFF